jgi:hypothetical protein
MERYGRIQGHYEGGLLWPKAPEWVKPFPVPDGIKLKNSITSRPVYRIFCNIDTHEPLKAAFAAIIAAGCAGELETFDGCFNTRWVRGCPGQFSFHSWALAFDFNAKANPLGGKSSWSSQFVECFKSAGFDWGGDFKKRPDPMHFQLAMIP